MSKPVDADIGALLNSATRQLHSDSPRLDAEVLLAHALCKPRSYLHAWPERVPDHAALIRFRTLLARRLAGEPVAHLTGNREFWSLSLAITPDTLIPRPDTETLVSLALDRIPPAADWQIADLGTGSGAIALALAVERPRCRITATDISPAALEVAAQNAERLGIDNVEFVCGDWCEALQARQFAMIVSNPPYIPSGDPHLAAGDLRFEPHGALAAGPDGLDALSAICRCAAAHLTGPCLLLLEHGFDQQQPVRELLATTGYHAIEDHPDAAGHSRVALASCS